MKRNGKSVNKGFSLIELVIVVVIIAIIGAIAIPRLSRGSAGAADSALVGNLSMLRKAIDTYGAEHGGTFPASLTVVAQLTQYSDDQGNTSTAKDSTHIYGPYIRTIPPLSVGVAKGNNGVATAAGTGIGWIYDATNGTVHANTTDTSPVEADSKGTLYSSY